MCVLRLSPRSSVGCASRIGGVGFDTFAADLLKRHDNAFPLRQVSDVSSQTLPNPGQLYWRNAVRAASVMSAIIYALQRKSQNTDYYDTAIAGAGAGGSASGSGRGSFDVAQHEQQAGHIKWRAASFAAFEEAFLELGLISA